MDATVQGGPWVAPQGTRRLDLEGQAGCFRRTVYGRVDTSPPSPVDTCGDRTKSRRRRPQRADYPTCSVPLFSGDCIGGRSAAPRCAPGTDVAWATSVSAVGHPPRGIGPAQRPAFWLLRPLKVLAEDVPVAGGPVFSATRTVPQIHRFNECADGRFHVGDLLLRIHVRVVQERGESSQKRLTTPGHLGSAALPPQRGSEESGSVWPRSHPAPKLPLSCIEDSTGSPWRPGCAHRFFRTCALCADVMYMAGRFRTSPSPSPSRPHNTCHYRVVASSSLD